MCVGFDSGKVAKDGYLVCQSDLEIISCDNEVMLQHECEPDYLNYYCYYVTLVTLVTTNRAASSASVK